MQMVGFSYGQAKSMGMLFMISSSVCNVHEISQRAQPVEHCITRGNRPVGRLADEVLDAKHLPPRCQGARTNLHFHIVGQEKRGLCHHFEWVL